MRLIESKAELLPQSPGIEGVYKMIELAGRTCYKSTDKRTDDSAKPFVDRMIASRHLAMLEHGTIYLFIPYTKETLALKYQRNPYSYVKRVLNHSVDTPHNEQYFFDSYITTNLRVLIEEGWLDDLQYLCEPTELHEKRYTFKLTTSIGVTRELNRHRVNSIAEMSTRYCNFSKSKFDNEIAFCKPDWDMNDESQDYWIYALSDAEKAYMCLIKSGWQPQQAREVLPLCTASEIVHTAFASDWRFFFDLRLFGKTGAPHPNMKHLAELMKVEAEKNGIWEDIMKYPSKFDAA